MRNQPASQSRTSTPDEPPAFRSLPARLALGLFLLSLSCSLAPAAVREIGVIGLTVEQLEREVDFFTHVLPFVPESESTSAPGEADELLGLTGTQLRTAVLRLGEERITLTEHLTRKGRPIPPDSRSFDHWFQHIAIVVSDMDRAYAQLRRAKVRHVSTAPQTLPAWNKEAGGIKAFYFRDPEDHVLEVIWFPPGKGDSKWQRPTTNLFLGIDHTAIVVSDTDQSLAFYTNALALHVVGGAENYGVEQEHLNQVFGARLRITALRAGRGPGIEFLEYIAPPGGRRLPDDAAANDLIFWQTSLLVSNLREAWPGLQAAGGTPVSRGLLTAPRLPASVSHAERAVLVRDPDGHALRLVESGEALAEK
jgi:catechol 2,3-dioxygenase-like lactoylglutathione lyase family enzyme